MDALTPLDKQTAGYFIFIYVICKVFSRIAEIIAGYRKLVPDIRANTQEPFSHGYKTYGNTGTCLYR